MCFRLPAHQQDVTYGDLLKSFTMTGLFQKVGSYVLSSLVSEYEPFAKCTVHIVKQQEVVTYLSPVKCLRQVIGKNCIWLLDRSTLNNLMTWFRGVQRAEIWNSKVSKIDTQNAEMLYICSNAETFVHVAIQNFTTWLSYTKFWKTAGQKTVPINCVVCPTAVAKYCLGIL